MLLVRDVVAVVVACAMVIMEPLGLLERDGALEHGTLQVIGRDVEVAAWFRLQVAVVHLHVDDAHELNLGGQLLDLLLHGIRVMRRRC